MKNQPDYDFSKHVKVPDEWIERALAVPSAPAAEPHRFSLRSRRLAAAAGVVLVLGLSISLYFSFRNISDTSDAVAPYADATAAAPTEITSQPAELFSEPTAAETDAPTVPPTPAKSTADAPSDAPSNAPTLAPTVNPTDPGKVPAVPSSHDPTTRPVTPPTTQPTEPARVPTEPTTPPAPPTEPPTAPSTEVDPQPATDAPPDSQEDYTLVEIMVPFDMPFAASVDSEESDKFYCRLYNSAGALIGDSNLFADSHRAYVFHTDRGSYLYYQQSIPTAGYASADSEYQYVVYNGNGATFLRGKTRE